MSTVTASGIEAAAGTPRAVQLACTRRCPRPRNGGSYNAGRARQQLTPALLGAG
jgi:hypothetical protein